MNTHALLPEIKSDTSRYSSSIPIGMGLLAILLGFTVQAAISFQDYGTLKSQLLAQDSIYSNATKVRLQLDAIAKGTVVLAQQGNSNAARILEDLKAAGVNINLGTKP